jgi:hypothetical protein
MREVFYSGVVVDPTCHPEFPYYRGAIYRQVGWQSFVIAMTLTRTPNPLYARVLGQEIFSESRLPQVKES